MSAGAATVKDMGNVSEPEDSTDRLDLYRPTALWNLGYRFSPEVQGRGYATELSRRALERAALTAPERPVVAYLLEHNRASAAVALKLGLSLVARRPDEGNPDPAAVRLIFADRGLDDAALEIAGS